MSERKVKPQDELADWKLEREHYPGWLVPPASNLGSLTGALKRSVHDGLAGDLLYGKPPEWSPVELVDAWFELNWRLEHALCAIDRDWVGRIEELLARTDPFHLAGHSDGEPVAPVQHWIFLAVACLRHYREFLLVEQFQGWHDRLQGMTEHYEDLSHILSHQMALFHLAFCDEVACRALLEKWDTTLAADPFWLARRAALFAEIGDVKSAFKLWTACQKRLYRDGTPQQPYFFTSRATWVMEVRGRLNVWNFDPEANKRPDDYWELLAMRDKTRPYSDLQSLSSRRPGFRREIRKAEATRKGGGISFRAPELWRPMNHVQLLRIREIAGFPYRMIANFLGFRMLSEQIWDCFDDLTYASPDLALVNLLSSQDSEFLDDRLPNEVVAVLPDAALSIAEAVIENLFKSLEHEETPSEQRKVYVDRTIGTLKVYLNHFFQRFDIERQVSIFKRFLGLAAQRKFIRPKDSNSYGEALNNMAVLIPAETYLALLPEIVEFPVLGDLPVHEFTWPEPGLYLRGSTNRPAELSSSRISKLIELSATSMPAFRLLRNLFKVGVLTDAEAAAWAETTWRNASDGLVPLNLPIRVYEYLEMPELEPDGGARAVKKTLLQGNIKHSSTGQGISIGGDVNEWFVSVLLATKGAESRWGDERIKLAWEPDEAFRLFDHIRQWWFSDGEVLVKRRGDIFNVLGERVHWAIRTLSRAILPYMPLDKFADVMELLNDMRDKKVSTIAAMPMMLKVHPELAPSVAQRIRRAIEADDEELRGEAFWAVVHWAEYGRAQGLPPMPPEILEKVAEYAIWHGMEDKGDSAIAAFKEALKQDPSTISERARFLLGLLLDGLRTKAVYPNDWYELPAEESDVVGLRAECVRLAAEAARAGMSSWEQVQYWLEVGRTDPLPQVRRMLSV